MSINPSSPFYPELDTSLLPGVSGQRYALQIGTVISGTTAAATLTGNPPNQRLNLTLPAGALSALVGDILPATDNVVNLGSASKRFASLHIGPGTLYITDQTLNTNAAVTVNNGVFNIGGVVQAQLPAISLTTLTFADSTSMNTAPTTWNPSYGSFESTATQTSGGTTSANLVTFNTVTTSSSTSIDTGATNSKITYANAGTYSIDFNGLYFFSGGASNYNITVWYAKNGVAVANSAYTFTTTSAQAAQVMGHITDLVTVAAGDYIQVYWWAAAAGVALTPTTAGTNPTRPASSSATFNTWRVA